MAEEKLEVKQVSDREIWVGENRHYLGEDNILYITAIGELDEELANRWKEEDLKLLKKFNLLGKKINVLVDLNKAGKPSSKARKILQDLSEEENAGKTALFGLHPVARVLASFFMGMSKGNIRFFKTKEEALNWLKE